MRSIIPDQILIDHAHHLIAAKTQHKLSKTEAKRQGLQVIHSINTGSKYKILVRFHLEWRRSVGLPTKGPYHQHEIQEFLFEFSETASQKETNSAKQAMQIVFDMKLKMVVSSVRTNLSHRAYTKEDVELLTSGQNSGFQLSTALCLEAGLRAHELLTLKLSTDRGPSIHRSWHEDRFIYSDPFVRYTVVGKGGLIREVAVPTKLAEELEKRRIDIPKLVKDRSINYWPSYDIAGGQGFSQSFTTASRKACGFSNGAHGLRHSFAQSRLATLKQHGLETRPALLILSQELGHFREDIVLSYLR